MNRSPFQGFYDAPLSRRWLGDSRFRGNDGYYRAFITRRFAAGFPLLRG
ncbi:MAG: hypothetical protein ACR2P4_10595 [Gammaproteobacteria bacterium]